MADGIEMGNNHDITINAKPGSAASWLLGKADSYADRLLSGEFKGALLISIPAKMSNEDAEEMIWRIHDLAAEYPEMRVEKNG